MLRRISGWWSLWSSFFPGPFSYIFFRKTIIRIRPSRHPSISLIRPLASWKIYFFP
jgi:hypothetical protein